MHWPHSFTQGDTLRMNRNIVLGIDPGLTVTGYAMIEAVSSGFRSIDNGFVRSDESEPFPSRLLKIADLLEQAVTRHRPGHAAIEAGFVGRDPGAAIKLAQVSGVCIVTLARFGLDVEGFAPRAVKLAATGWGVSSKAKIESAVRAHIENADPANEHVADAYAVAVAMALKTGLALPNSRMRCAC